MARFLNFGVCRSVRSEAIAHWHVQAVRPLTVAGAVIELCQIAHTVFTIKSFAESRWVLFGACTLVRILSVIKRKKEFVNLILKF